MEKEKNTVPPEIGEADGSRYVELLRAISANPECAHVLAAIASGGDPAELIATLLPGDVPPETEEETACSVDEAAPEPAMYQSRVEVKADEGVFPLFLSDVQNDFFDF